MLTIKTQFQAFSYVQAAFLAFLVLFSSALIADVNKKLEPMALKGYDPVNYFHGAKAMKGDDTYETIYKGNRYHFISQENKAFFSANPEQYTPQFGGHCAGAATSQNPIIGDPSIYAVDNGQLFLFSSVEAKNNWSNEVNKNNAQLIDLALNGNDVTSYFEGLGAVKGDNQYQATYRGKRYLFTNQQNQQKFANSPEKFLPQFDGYCSHSVSQGTPMKSDPDLYIVNNGNLFLFSTQAAKDVWMNEPIKTRTHAEKNWKLQAIKRKEQIEAKNTWRAEGKVKLFTF
jgi:YHS domain-containing protein